MLFKVMVVDRSPLVGQALEHIMNKHRPNTSFIGQAFSGTTALDLAQKNTPDLVLTDIFIPELDGLAMAKKLIKTLPKISIVILTASDDFRLVEKALRIGVKAYQLKPISHKDLLLVLDTLSSMDNTQTPQSLPKLTLPRNNELQKIIRSGTAEQICQCKNDILYQLSEKSGGDLNIVRTELIILATEITSSEKNTNLNGLLSTMYKQFLGDIISTNSHQVLFLSFNNFIDKASSIYNLGDQSYSFELVSRIQELIEIHLNDNITLERIADEMFFTTSYLSRLFKKQIGKNFSDYLIDRRLEKAKLLLLSTNRSIDSIAQETGYENANSFRRLFKSKIGLSASQYRSSHYKQSNQ